MNWTELNFPGTRRCTRQHDKTSKWWGSEKFCALLRYELQCQEHHYLLWNIRALTKKRHDLFRSF